MSKTGWTLVIIALVVGVIAGWGGAQGRVRHTSATLAASESSENAVNSAFNSSATNLRLSLNNLLREHAVMGGGALVALYDGINTSRAEQLLNDNGNQIASIIQTVYGKNAHDTFLQLWMQHMQQYKNYTVARKNNDTAKMNQAKQQLQTIATKMGDLFSQNSKNLSAATVSSLMMEHINDTLEVVDAAASGNTTQTTNTLQAGYTQAGKFADTLARGMILDKPDIFQ